MFFHAYSYHLDIEKPIVLAHQGASADAPGNTLPAFDLAVQSGCDVLETDVHFTKDGEIVVCHDDCVDFVTETTGKIKDFTFAQLRSLDFGYSYSIDGQKTFPYRGRNIRILALRELLKYYPKQRFNIDVKPARGGSLRAFLRVLEECQARHRVMVASFHHQTLLKLRSFCPSLSTSASPREVALFLYHSFLGKHDCKYPFQAIQVPVKTGPLPIVTKRLIEYAQLVNIPVHVWTIDDPTQIQYYLRMGVAGIVTNRPQIAVSIRNQHFK